MAVRPHSARTIVSGLALVWVGLGLGLLAGVARAEPYATGAAELLLNARPEAGLVTLHSGYRNHPLIDAEALVWLGYDLNDPDDADVLTINVGLREPNGYGSARVGRLIIASGAIRPVHVDGVRLLGRAPFGTSLETFAGVPVQDGLPGAFDWLAGGRLAQQLWQERLGLGLSYIHQRDRGMLANEEVGGDLSLEALPSLWLRALSSWDLGLAGLAAAQLEALYATSDLNARVYGERRVAARLLPATSLFSTISDRANSELGGDGDYRLFPRLSVGGRLALQWIDGAQQNDYGYRLTARSRLALDDADGGDVLLSLSRLGGFETDYSAAYLAVERSMGRFLRAHAAGELLRADGQRDGGGQLYPFVNLGLSYRDERGLSLSAGLIARATPEYTHELTVLVRLGYQESATP